MMVGECIVDECGCVLGFDGTNVHLTPCIQSMAKRVALVIDGTILVGVAI